MLQDSSNKDRNAFNEPLETDDDGNDPAMDIKAINRVINTVGQNYVV